MIKIEFKEAKTVMSSIADLPVIAKVFYNNENIRWIPALIKNITFGSPSELVPSRDEVLQQLGISKEQDDEMQAKYSIEHVKPNDL